MPREKAKKSAVRNEKPQAAKKTRRGSRTTARRTRISQEKVPVHTLSEAMRVAKALAESYAFKPTAPLLVAKAMDMQPTSGVFRTLCGSAIAYGLTEGGYNAKAISLTTLSTRIVRPTKEGDDLAAKREAILHPVTIRTFLEEYDGAVLPREDIARTVLHKMGVPMDRTHDVLSLILGNAEEVQILQSIGEKRYVHLGSPGIPQARTTDTEVEPEQVGEVSARPETQLDQKRRLTNALPIANKKVYVTHGKNTSLVDSIKKLLGFSEMEPIVSVERATVSKPIPEKVMDDMRSCRAAIIHVDDEQRLIDREGKEHVVLNANVLIEIGAAMALYRKRFILLVKEGITVPSNLQGLFEVRYSGQTLDGDTTMRMLEAITDMKKNPVPAE